MLELAERQYDRKEDFFSDVDGQYMGVRVPRAPNIEKGACCDGATPWEYLPVVAAVAGCTREASRLQTPDQGLEK
jgi:hypothetical protein